MDLQFQYRCLNRMINVLDNAITEKKFNPLRLSVSNGYTIMHIVDSFNENNFRITPMILLLLYKKNKSFAQAIDYFGRLAYKNLHIVTCDNLEVIENPISPQPMEELNLLPLSIKEYVMFLLRDQIKREYKICFSLGEKNKIISFDICPYTDLAATSSTNGNCCLWSLKTGQLYYLLPEHNRVDKVQFNYHGTKLTLITRSDAGDRQLIKIYDLQTIRLWHAIEPIKRIDIFAQQANRDYIQKGNYLAECRRTFDESILYITKYNCTNLALCERAIANTNNQQSLQKLWSLSSYIELTPIEKGIIHGQYQQKVHTLTTIKTQQPSK